MANSFLLHGSCTGLTSPCLTSTGRLLCSHLPQGPSHIGPWKPGSPPEAPVRSPGVGGRGTLQSQPQISLLVPFRKFLWGLPVHSQVQGQVTEKWRGQLCCDILRGDVSLWETTSPSRSEESGGALCSGASGRQARDGRKGPVFLEAELEANETLMARLSQ